MAKIIGKNCDFGIGTLGSPPYTPSALGSIETLGNDITLNIDLNTDESTGYGVDFKTFEIIDAQWSVDMTLYYSTDTDEIDEKIISKILTTPFVKYGFAFSPVGGSTPATDTPIYSGDVIITSAVPNPPRGGVASVRVRLQGTGSLTRTV